jgi:RES domain-containing protein
MIHGARWNSPGRPVIYAASAFALALLEVLAHAQIGTPPPELRVVEISIPSDASLEILSADDLIGWDAADYAGAQRFGDLWLSDGRSAVLVVPSVLSPAEANLVINPRHPDFVRIIPSAERDLALDLRLRRLFGTSTAPSGER